jgi:uncharacterized protein
MINPELKQYIEEEILPRYDLFDAAHRRDHAIAVIERSLELCKGFDADVQMAYTIAAYHDTGLAEGRENHHTASARIVRQDKTLRRWFSEEQISIIADATEDHRASAKREPRSIYGRIVAEADRQIEPHNIIRRTIQYGLTNYPQLDTEGHWARTIEHLEEKYAEGGYLKLWIADSENGRQLTALRKIIADKTHLRQIFDCIFAEEHNG